MAIISIAVSTAIRSEADARVGWAEPGKSGSPSEPPFLGRKRFANP
jgi:hypothetical protein